MALTPAYPTSSSTLSTMAQWEAFFTGMAADGVIPGAANEYVPSLNAGARTAVMGTGSAQIRGFHVDAATSTATAIPAASAQGRVDRLVLRLDRAAATAEGWITPVVITGTPAASNPQPPAWAQTSGGLYDLPISRWTSAANGSLTGLVDERVFAAGAPQAFRSDARPSANIRRIGFEADTGRVVYATGSTWQLLGEDTGWVDLSMNGVNGSAWSANTICRVRKVNGWVQLRIAVKRWATNALATSDPDGSIPIRLTAAFQPAFTMPGSGYHSRSPVAIQVETSGDVRIYPLTADIPAGRTVSASASYPVG